MQKKTFIINSGPNHFVDNNQESTEHFFNYKEVMSELKGRNDTINLARDNLLYGIPPYQIIEYWYERQPRRVIVDLRIILG